MSRIWRFLNSPLVVLLLALGLWPVVSALEHRYAVRSTFETVFTELNRSTDQLNDRAKKSGIKTLVSSFVTQFVEGFASAFDSVGAGQAAKLTDFTATVSQVSLLQVKTVPSNFSSKEKVIGIIHNESSVAISDIHLNLTLYGTDGSLLDVLEQTLHDVKILQPGQSVGFTADHDLGDSNQDKGSIEARKAAKVSAQIVGFDIQKSAGK